jgi:hypothetical protein
MKVNVKDNRIPDGYRVTSDLRDSGEWSMDTANEEYILALLRGLAPDVTEGRADSLWGFTIAEDGDWSGRVQRRQRLPHQRQQGHARPR